MPPEIIHSEKLKIGQQEDRSIIVNEMYSDNTLVEIREDGFSYYLLDRNEVTHWIKALLPYVNFGDPVKERVKTSIEEGIRRLNTNPGDKDSVLRLDFSFKEARPFSRGNNVVRFMNQDILNETFLKILPHGTLERWGWGKMVDKQSWHDWFLSQIGKTVALSQISTGA